ncbi:MAG: YicC family protein [Desulfovibrio sp.]|nr:YicC family protein [Desulfovibrio sp.]
MPVSMTGYGRGEGNGPGFHFVWELRSVNGRFFDVKWKLPPAMRCKEQEWEKILHGVGSRGRVEASLNLEVAAPELLGMRLNGAQARAMIEQVRGLAGEYEKEFVPDFNRFLSMPSLWRENSAEPDPAMLEAVEQGLRDGVQDWQRSRHAEGKAMVADLLERIATLRTLAEAIAERVPVVLAEKREALVQRVREMVEAAEAAFSEDRMLQEVAILTDRLDVSEELTRLAEHLHRMEEVLGREGDVGKRLDFLVQETFREINTCGNKAQDSEVSRLTVDFKAELEKCREQVQNIE